MRVIRPIIACAALMFSSLAVSAPITWGSAQNTVGALDVLTTGSLVEALNGGTTNSGSVTVNGVTFTNTASLLPEGGFSGALDGSTSGDTNYDALLNTFDHGGGVSTSFSIGGSLLSGSNYLLQVWFTDLRSCCSSRDMSYGDGLGNNVDLNASGSELGQYAVGQFTADSASQTLALASNGFANAHITAYQLRTAGQSTPVPVPAPLLLVGLGLVLLGARGTRLQR